MWLYDKAGADASSYRFLQARACRLPAALALTCCRLAAPPLPQGEDDGSAQLPVGPWLAAREGAVLEGFYATFTSERDLQFVSYSTDVVREVKAYLERKGEERCAYVQAIVLANKAMQECIKPEGWPDSMAQLLGSLEQNIFFVTELLRALAPPPSNQGGRTRGGGGGTRRLYIIDTPEKRAAVAAKARTLISELLFPNAAFATAAQADVLAAKLVPGAASVEEAARVAADFDSVRKLVFAQAGNLRRQLSTRACEAMEAQFAPDMESAEQKQALLESYCVEQGGSLPVGTLRCLAYAMRHGGTLRSDEELLQRGALALPAGAAAYALEAMAFYLRREPTPRACTTLNVDGRLVAYGDLLLQRTAALKARRWANVVWTAAPEEL